MVALTRQVVHTCPSLGPSCVPQGTGQTGTSSAPKALPGVPSDPREAFTAIINWGNKGREAGWLPSISGPAQVTQRAPH